MYSQRIRTHPPIQERTQKSLPKILQPNLDVLLLAREPIILPEPLPARVPIIAVRAAVGEVRAAFNELGRRFWGCSPGWVPDL
jgi:hypothetical protein